MLTVRYLEDIVSSHRHCDGLAFHPGESSETLTHLCYGDWDGGGGGVGGALRWTGIPSREEE